MKKLAKHELPNLLQHWTDHYAVLAPLCRENGDGLMGAYEKEAFSIDYGKPPLPPKSAFLPQSEVIFQVENGEYRERLSAQKRLLFGIRSCDLLGLRQSESFMGRAPADLYYKTRRDAATVVVMACPGPQNETCFCATMQSGPTAGRGFDLQFFPIGEDYLIEVGSQKGEAALSAFPLADLDDGQAASQIDAFRKRASAAIEGREAVLAAMQRLKDQRADEEVWERLGRKCILCGGCAFVCPTCTCFNVSDQLSGPGQGVRERSWDACLFGGFTREASGHNPRPTQALRLKRRHEHKLLHYQEADLQGGVSGCTGCGRCSDFCPVHIGTLEVAAAIAAGEQGEG